jgi:hypothetical protein
VSTNIARRLKRLEAALTPTAPEILTIIAVAGREIISEHHLVMYPTNKRNQQTRYWGQPDQAALLDRR